MVSHQKVRTAKILRIGLATGAVLVLTVSAAPRAGSLIKKMNTASSKPGSAAIKKGARQLPKASTIAPTVKNASSRPSGKPSMNMPMARARLCAGNRSPSSELAAGA